MELVTIAALVFMVLAGAFIISRPINWVARVLLLGALLVVNWPNINFAIGNM